MQNRYSLFIRSKWIWLLGVIVVCCYGSCRKRTTKPQICAKVGREMPGSSRQKLQTFKMVSHIWNSPRVSSEASYPQNGWSSYWNAIFPFWTILPNFLNLKIIGDVGCFFYFKKTFIYPSPQLSRKSNKLGIISWYPPYGWRFFSQPLSLDRQPREWHKALTSLPSTLKPPPSPSPWTTKFCSILSFSSYHRNTCALILLIVKTTRSLSPRQ